MNEQFMPVALADIETKVRQHLESLPGSIDSFLEQHIQASNHYLITAGSESAGFASIYDSTLITQFVVDEPFRKYGQQLFEHLRRMEQVQSAFVPTCDEFYLAHALDEYRQLEKQAYLFRSAPSSMRSAVGWHWALELASAGDAEFIQRHAGDFFDPLEQRIEAGELFLTLRQGECAGFGSLVRSAFHADVASIGMFTVESHRHKGVGTATITMLIEKCSTTGLRAVAGCAYSNHLSKQTLERAGMYSPTRLLRVEF